MPTRFFVVAALCLLAACSSSPPTGDVSTATAHDRIEAWLARAKDAASPEREQLQLQAAELLLRNRELDAAASTLQGIDTRALSAELYAWLIQLQAGLKLAQGDPATALARLDDVDLEQIGDRIPLPRQVALGQLRARALALTGQHFASAQERIFLAPLLAEKNREANREALWQSLMSLESSQLHHYYSQALSDDLRGWLALALLARDTQLGLQSQSDQFDQWLREWPNHPAAEHPPANLRLIRKLAAEQPTQVALLLPLSGRLQAFGLAVRDGFMAAWYEQSGQRPTVQVYDTEAGDIVALYQQAVAEGAQLVIGPLDKQRVGELQLHGSLPVPVLALNRSELDAPPPRGFYQFSLAPEDEARLLAEAAAQQTFRRALILAPNDDSSQRVLAAFTERWQELGGSVANSVPLEMPDTYSDRVIQALNLDLSKNRAAALQRVIGRNVSFTPRRRQDIDFVLLLTRPQSARSLKPLLAYHYAGDLPVYATSRIYDGYPQPALDRDLNGIVFSDIPWLLNPDDPLRNAIEDNFPRQRSYLRLYALGIDSFRLYPRLEQLAQLPNSRLYGRTGNLKLNDRGEVERDLALAHFVQGVPQRLPFDRSLEYPIGDPQLIEYGADSGQRNSRNRSGSVDPAASTDAGRDTGHETQPFWN